MSEFSFVKKVARPRVEEPDPVEEEAAVVEPIMYFEPGTAIYQLVTERLDVLEKTITNATKEYEELSKYIKGEE